MLQPLAPFIAPSILAREVASFSPGQRLVRAHGLEIWVFKPTDAPSLMHALGRSREETFREIGEGSGHSLDVDKFDEWYHQLVLWDPAKQAIAGGYRIGHVDRIVADLGPSGLYTKTLFHFDEAFLAQLPGAVELGRGFVTRAYQRDFAPLMMLWQGIGVWIDQHPGVRYILGSVSISKDFSPSSRNLMARYLTQPRYSSDLAPMVRAVRPFLVAQVDHETQAIGSFGALTRAVVNREVDGKRPPPLLKHYLTMGAKVLDLNVDPNFGSCLGALCVLDLHQTPDRILGRFLGEEALTRFRAIHSLFEQVAG